MKHVLVFIAMAFLCVGLAPLPALSKATPEEARLLTELVELNKSKKKEDFVRGLGISQRLLEIAERNGNEKLKTAALIGLGGFNVRLGDYRKALPHLEKLEALLKGAKDPQQERLVRTMLGMTHERLGQNLQALEAYARALEIARKLKDRKEESAALYNMGKVCRSSAKYDKAIEFFERGVALDRELKDQRSEAAKLHALGNLYRNRNHYDQALDHYSRALTIYRSFDDRSKMWRLLASFGTLYSLWGEYEKALDFHEQAFQITQQLKHSDGQASCHVNFGNVYLNWGEYDKAMDHYNNALAMYTELWSQTGLASCYSNIANLYQKRGQYDKAVELYREALGIRTHSWDQRGQATCYCSLGSVYEQWGQYDKAMDLYKEALDIRTELKLLSDQPYPLMGIGTIHWRKGEYQDALDRFRQALKICTELKVPTRWANVSIAGVHLDLGEIGRAESYVHRLKAEYKGQRNQTGLWSFLGRLHLLKSDFRTSKEHYERLLSFAEQNRSAGDLFTAYAGIGLCQEGLGDLAAAAESFRKAVEHTEEVRSTISEEQRETFFDVKTGGFRRTEPYEGLARVLTKMNRPIEAFRSSEFTKARVFAETLARSLERDATDVPPEVRIADADLNQRLSALKSNRQAAYDKGDPRALSVLDPQIKALEDKRDTHIKMLRKNYPLFAATKYPRPMDLSQTALTDNDWVLSYDVTDPGLIVYLTKGKTLKRALFKPLPRKDLDALVRKFRDPLDIKSKETIEEKISKFDFVSGRKLADILLTDILPEVPKDAPLVIVPADCLGVLPFEMLVLNDGGKIVEKDGRPNTSGADFFGDRNPISYYQSITALTLARNFAKQKGSGNKTLVMCDPVFSDDDPRVVKERKETRRALLDTITSDVMSSAKTQNGITWRRMALTGDLGKSLKKTDPSLTDIYDGLQATKATFRQQKLDQYKNIVFATHGYAGTDLGGLKEPVLVLTLVNQPPGETGFLGMSEVMGLKMNADMVALTACQSGLGKRISGEGTMGMGRAFQYAGAKSTLMTLWSVAQKSSVQLTESFFKHLKEGKPKLEALKLARDEIRKNGYDHPFFWASFILVGEVN